MSARAKVGAVEAPLLHRDEVAIEVAGRMRYEWAARRRPFVHPLRSPAGLVLTVDAPDDHPWHHGLWFTIKFVDGDNFWEEYDAYGVLRHDGEPHISHDQGAVTIDGALDWVRPDRATVALREHRRWTYRPVNDTTYSLDLTTTLVPVADAVLDRTPFTTWGGYGGLTFRGRPDFVETTLRIADDDEAHERVLGTSARWLDCTGTIEGHRVGIAMLDHPTNSRHPTPWYASTRADAYGSDGWSNFVNAALLWEESLLVPAAAPLALRYRVLVHDGDLDRREIDDAWATWAGER